MENGSKGKNASDTEPPLISENSINRIERIKRAVLGKPRDIKDPTIFHRISLIAFFAWVGLGADGLSSSAYGPEEAFRALGEHTYLAIGLVLATAFTSTRKKSPVTQSPLNRRISLPCPTYLWFTPHANRPEKACC